MTLILMVATIAVLVFLGMSCRRARLDLEEQICDCLHATVPATVGYGPGAVEASRARPGGPVFTRIDGGRAGAGAARGHGRHHLRVVRAG
jgi:hypothetical protein